MRLETVLQTVKKTDILYQEKNYGNFLAFEPVALVPFEPHLIDYNLLSDDQINWLNNYNKITRQLVGEELTRQNKKRYFTITHFFLLGRVSNHEVLLEKGYFCQFF